MSHLTVEELKRFKHPKGDARNYWFDGVSTYVVKLLLYTAITPLQVNFSVTIVGLFIGIAFALSTVWGHIAALVLFFLYIILDAADGQLARARDDCTLEGAYLDKMGHYVVYPLIAMGMGYGNYRTTGAIAMVWVGFALGLAMTLASASSDCFRLIYGDVGHRTSLMTADRRGFRRGLFRAIVRFETMLYLVVLAALADAAWNTGIQLLGIQFNLESFVILFYSTLLLLVNVGKICIVVVRGQLLGR